MPLDVIISPLALYNEDDSIFDNLTLPAITENTAPSWGNNYLSLLRDRLYSVDKTDFIGWLLLNTAEMSTIYTSPESFKEAIKFWSATRSKLWQQIYETQFFRYNPIWNKDGTITLNESTTRNLVEQIGRTDTTTYGHRIDSSFGHPTETLTRTGGRTETVRDRAAWTEEHSGKDTTKDTFGHSESESYTNYSETHEVTQDDTTRTVAAYDSSSLEPREKNARVMRETTTPAGTKTKQMGGNADTSELEHGETVQRTGTAGEVTTEYDYKQGGEVEQRVYSGDDSESVTHSGSDSLFMVGTNTDTGTTGGSSTRIEQGNIGVTSTQELIMKEREILQFNIYEYILADFKENFMIMMY